MGKKPQIAVLLANTGTPDDPSPEAVRRYLRDYLKDRRIVEMPPFIWLPILYGTVLRKRPAKSAAKYRQIWTPEGSPLVVHARKIAEGLNERMKASDLPVRVEYSMCYGNPSLDAQIRKIVAEGIEKLFILPLFPQYSPQTVGSVMDTVGKTYRTLRNIPATRTVKRFCDRDDWVQAMAQHVRNYWAEHGEPWSEGGKLIFSFHGVPEECVKEKGDTYQQECLDSSKAIAAALNLTSEQWETDFQSRFGPQEWLQPYTIERAKTLASEGVNRLDIICPSFTCDCLETDEEVDLEIRKVYEEANPSGHFHYIPCLNSTPGAIDFYERLIRDELQGWL